MRCLLYSATLVTSLLGESLGEGRRVFSKGRMMKTAAIHQESVREGTREEAWRAWCILRPQTGVNHMGTRKDVVSKERCDYTHDSSGRIKGRDVGIDLRCSAYPATLDYKRDLHGSEKARCK